MVYLHKLNYLRPHRNIEGADPASDHPLGKDPLGIGDGSFCCRHRGRTRKEMMYGLKERFGL